MNLFDIENHKVTFAPQALLLDPFKKLWDSDNTPNKEQAVLQLAFVYYYCDYKSDFFNLLDDKERFSAIKEVMPNVLINKDVENACKFYIERQETISLKLLKDGLIGVEKLRKFITSVNLEERDKHNKLVHNAKAYKDVLQGLGDVSNSINKTLENIKKELEEKSTMKGSRTKKLFEDGI